MRLVLAEEEHAGQRRNAERRDFLAQEQARAHVHHRLAAGTNVELVRARRALRVEQCVGSQRGRARFGLHQPEPHECRELFALAADGIDRETARGQAVALAAPSARK